MFSKRIYPFGNNSLCAGDMLEQVLPIYAHIWDFLHGKSDLFFDWTTGLGNNLAGSLWHLSAISPGSLFFLFISRDNIEKSMSIFIAIKLLVTGYTFSYVLKKWIKDLPFLMMSSAVLLYVFQPFCMQYYMMPGWLDMVSLFPLVIYFLRKLLIEGDTKGYIITLSLFIQMNMQQTFMLMLAVVLTVATGLIIDRKRYDKHLAVFAMASFFSALLTSWIWIPGIVQTVGSARNDTNYTLLHIYESIWVFHPDKWYKVVSMGVMIGLMLAGITRNRKCKSLQIIWIISVLLMVPLVLENTNLLWHGGSYESFVYRFAYMMDFWIIVGGCYSFNQAKSTDVPERKYTLPFFTVVFSSALGVCTFFLMERAKESCIYSLVMIFAGIVVGILFSLNEYIVTKICCCVITVILSVIIGTNGMKVWNDLDHSESSRANTIYDSEMFHRGIYSRVKNDNPYVTQTLNMYSGFMGIGNYLPVCESDRINTLNELGYARVGHRMSDMGGTPFSDNILGFTYNLCTEKMDSPIYHHDGNISDFNIYRTNNEYKPGILINKEDMNYYETGENPFDIQNNLAGLILKKKLLKKAERIGDEKYTISLEEPSIVYCYLSPESETEKISITSEDPEARMCDEEYSFGNTTWENGIIALGEYEKGHYVIEVQGDDPEFDIAYMPVREFLSVTPDYADDFSYVMNHSGVDISARVQGDRYLFVPVYPNKGWNCKVNGQKTDIVPIQS
ncbi:MAG: YfhO family protein, partial [Lachnospiraceae bacterium]|nr:YfhO family protein [Lachnospiraceae bacterium]